MTRAALLILTLAAVLVLAVCHDGLYIDARGGTIEPQDYSEYVNGCLP